MERTINVNDASLTDAELAEGELSTADLSNAVGGFCAVAAAYKLYGKVENFVSLIAGNYLHIDD